MKIAAIIALSILAVVDVLLVMACIKLSGDLSEEEENEE